MSQLYCTGQVMSEPELRHKLKDWGYVSARQRQGYPDQAKDPPTPEIIDGERENLPE